MSSQCSVAAFPLESTSVSVPLPFDEIAYDPLVTAKVIDPGILPLLRSWTPPLTEPAPLADEASNARKKTSGVRGRSSQKRRFRSSSTPNRDPPWGSERDWRLCLLHPRTRTQSRPLQ